MDTKKQLQSTTKIVQKTQSELYDTKSKLETTTKFAQKTQNELQVTKDHLLTATQVAEQTQRELVKTKEELDRVKEELKSKEIKIEESCVVKIKPATAPKPSLKVEKKVVDVVQLMGELVQPNPPQTTQQTYAEKLHRVFNKIKNGQLFHVNDNECFFKLWLQRNHRKFYIYHVNDVIRYRDEDTKFANDVVLLQDRWSRYHLYLKIENYDVKNCRLFLVDVEECGKNHLLEYGGNDIYRWELYKNQKEEVIFYFKKK